MATQNTIKPLIDSLSTLAQNAVGNSESANRQNQAQEIVRQSSLDEETIKAVCAVIAKAANPTGWYYDNNGIKAGIAALEALQTEEETTATIPLNRTNLKNPVSDGSIFNVKFIKRTTGELRSMTCRLGVQRHLSGGKKAFNDKTKDLLTVFDMKNKGYRSIPVDGIQELRVNGQSFCFRGAA